MVKGERQWIYDVAACKWMNERERLATLKTQKDAREKCERKLAVSKRDLNGEEGEVDSERDDF